MRKNGSILLTSVFYVTENKPLAVSFMHMAVNEISSTHRLKLDSLDCFYGAFILELGSVNQFLFETLLQSISLGVVIKDTRSLNVFDFISRIIQRLTNLANVTF